MEYMIGATIPATVTNDEFMATEKLSDWGRSFYF